MPVAWKSCWLPHLQRLWAGCLDIDLPGLCVRQEILWNSCSGSTKPEKLWTVSFFWPVFSLIKMYEGALLAMNSCWQADPRSGWWVKLRTFHAMGGWKKTYEDLIQTWHWKGFQWWVASHKEGEGNWVSNPFNIMVKSMSPGVRQTRVQILVLLPASCEILDPKTQLLSSSVKWG